MKTTNYFYAKVDERGEITYSTTDNKYIADLMNRIAKTKLKEIDNKLNPDFSDYISETIELLEEVSKKEVIA